MDLRHLRFFDISESPMLLLLFLLANAGRRNEENAAENHDE
jgi:hypothetical protein